ncbi:nuclear transport factor 2 family protein [uncultured Winogradskyella sp.]|uniref:nuclear transport factor 2 family protein n=1 Tax=uncultured Winogradskyella sp. TaxID=395353 RepID=UPI0030D7CC09|tara:strand:- start:65887 stop:67059 length:1173 start_codon:yes stop_codon:yes gene_type:complete
MKYTLLLLAALTLNGLRGQNTEVHLFNITNTNGELDLINTKKIKQNPGYNNQPSFYNDNLILFASTRNDQTDIAKYNIRNAEVAFINETPNGGEYSAQKIPNSKDISAVRLDNDGKQRLYKYNFNTGTSTVLIKDLVVAYYTWYNDHIIVSSVIEANTLNLYVSNLKTGKNTKYASNVGRAFQKIPNTNLVSFISKENEKFIIKSLDPITGAIELITETIGEDICWLINGNILIPSKQTIYKFNPKTDKSFSVLKTFSADHLQNITRITTNAIGTMLALVSEVSPEYIVQKQLDAYNARDIDAFMATYTADIELYNFPETLRSKGQEPMRKSYMEFFKNTPNLNCQILKRIVIGNKVIDHELVTANGNTFKAVAVYEVENGLIRKVTFIR